MITQTTKELKEVLSRACYVPHGIRGQFKMIGPLPEGRDQDDSCNLISAYSQIDLTGNVTIGRWVMIGSGALLLTHTHPYHGKIPLLKVEESVGEEFTLPVDKTIGDDVWIHQSVILPQCHTISSGVVIGIGSVVTKPIIGPYSVWAGNPARKIGYR